MEIQKFEIGDIVQLKSGGPLMTVKNYAPQFNLGNGSTESQTDVICTYTEEGGEIVNRRFHQDMLIIARS